MTDTLCNISRKFDGVNYEFVCLLIAASGTTFDYRNIIMGMHKGLILVISNDKYISYADDFALILSKIIYLH